MLKHRTRILQQSLPCPKEDRWLSTILNLQPQNQFLKYHHFKMENLKSIILSQKKGDWGASLDLSDAYLHLYMFQYTKTAGDF